MTILACWQLLNDPSLVKHLRGALSRRERDPSRDEIARLCLRSWMRSPLRRRETLWDCILLWLGFQTCKSWNRLMSMHG